MGERRVHVPWWQSGSGLAGVEGAPGQAAVSVKRAISRMSMALSLDQQHALLIAERSRDVGVIAAAVNDVLAENPHATLLDIETAFRDEGSHVYLIAGPTLSVVIGMPAWRVALDRAGLSPETNRMALAGTHRRRPA